MGLFSSSDPIEKEEKAIAKGEFCVSLPPGVEGNGQSRSCANIQSPNKERRSSATSRRS
jgi:hypothetical protein